MDEKFDAFLDSDEADEIFSAIQLAIKEAFLAGYQLGQTQV